MPRARLVRQQGGFARNEVSALPWSTDANYTHKSNIHTHIWTYIYTTYSPIYIQCGRLTNLIWLNCLIRTHPSCEWEYGSVFYLSVPRGSSHGNYCFNCLRATCVSFVFLYNYNIYTYIGTPFLSKSIVNWICPHLNGIMMYSFARWRVCACHELVLLSLERK